MHTPTRSACRPLSSLALMAALGALPLAAAAQQLSLIHISEPTRPY